MRPWRSVPHPGHMDATFARERMLAGLDVERRQLDIDGIQTETLETGRGPLVVLLHGAIECGGAMWAPVVARLARRCRLLIPDLPGLGESAPAPRLDFATFTRWFDGLLDQTAFDGCALVAHSMGGSLAARYAVDHGGRLSALVICGGPAIGPYRIPARLQWVAIRFAIRPTRKNFDRFKRFALLDVDATGRLDPEWFDAWDAYTQGAGERPGDEALDAPVGRRAAQADRRRRPRPHHGADRAGLGTGGPDGAARDRGACKRAPRLAVARDRSRRARCRRSSNLTSSPPLWKLYSARRGPAARQPRRRRRS